MNNIDSNVASTDFSVVFNDAVDGAGVIKKQWISPTCEAFGARFTDGGKIFQPFENTVSSIAFGS